MDDADRTEERMEVELERLVRAARGVPRTFSLHCDDCGDALEAHRQAFGRCVACQEVREARDRQHWVGV